MERSPTRLARELLAGDAGGLEELRLHVFEDDESAHDDEFIEKLYTDFSDDFDRVKAALTTEFGAPLRVGEEDDEVIPLNGVFRYAVWEVGDRLLFAAAAHEDRGVPIILLLDTAAAENA
jgi:hypothetical protein